MWFVTAGYWKWPVPVVTLCHLPALVSVPMLQLPVLRRFFLLGTVPLCIHMYQLSWPWVEVKKRSIANGGHVGQWPFQWGWHCWYCLPSAAVWAAGAVRVVPWLRTALHWVGARHRSHDRFYSYASRGAPIRCFHPANQHFFGAANAFHRVLLGLPLRFPPLPPEPEDAPRPASRRCRCRPAPSRLPLFKPHFAVRRSLALQLRNGDERRKEHGARCSEPRESAEGSGRCSERSGAGSRERGSGEETAAEEGPSGAALLGRRGRADSDLTSLGH